MPPLHTSSLSQYAADVNAAFGDYTHPTVVARYEPLELRYDTFIDQSLSPYSDEYFTQQLELYKEVAGRELDQAVGELHGDDIEALEHAANPMGITDAANIAEHVRCISSMLALACLDGSPTVLDVGAGHGLGSEVLAYTGCAVHAVDIDPALGTLSRKRTAARNLNVTRFDMNFDDLGALDADRYDAAFFSQALHHALKPWELIAALGTRLRADGVIAFVGEPIQNIWWQHWGLRLDPVSLYVARERGWFESGWSYDFIRDCFARSGFHLTFISGGFQGDAIGVATRTESKRQAVLAQARLLGLNETHRPEMIGADAHYRTATGVPTALCGRPAFRSNGTGTGALVYGPYANAKIGRYEASMLIQQNGRGSRFGNSGMLTIDAVHGAGGGEVFRMRIRGKRLNEPRLLRHTFHLGVKVKDLEVRAFARPDEDWIVSVPVIRRLPDASVTG